MMILQRKKRGGGESKLPQDTESVDFLPLTINLEANINWFAWSWQESKRSMIPNSLLSLHPKKKNHPIISGAWKMSRCLLRNHRIRLTRPSVAQQGFSRRVLPGYKPANSVRTAAPARRCGRAGTNPTQSAPCASVRSHKRKRVCLIYSRRRVIVVKQGWAMGLRRFDVWLNQRLGISAQLKLHFHQILTAVSLKPFGKIPDFTWKAFEWLETLSYWWIIDPFACPLIGGAFKPVFIWFKKPLSSDAFLFD